MACICMSFSSQAKRTSCMTLATAFISLLFFFSLFLSHGFVELEESHHVYRILQTSESTSTTTQPYRTGYHFQPLDNWMNDPNGPMIYKGIYHLFYQYNPKGAIWGNIVWGHHTSTDLVDWTSHDQAIYPSQPFDVNGCWSGSVTILPGGKPAILYTGVDPEKRQVQNLAVPKNLSDPYLREWVKSPKNPLISPSDQIDPSLFRDPTTAWLSPDKRWRMIIGSRIKDQGLAILYRSIDFVDWVKAETLFYSGSHTGMWECPDFFPVSTDTSLKGVDTSANGPNIKHVLKVSFEDTFSDCYTIGMYNVTTDKYIPEEGLLNGVSGLRYDYGKFYASKTFFDSSKNRRILWGWINESSSQNDDINKGWSGLQAIPRSIWLEKSGKQLIQWPIEEIERLRGNQVKFPSQLLEGGSLLEVTGCRNYTDVEISFEISDFEKAEVLDPNWTNPQLLCSQKGASVNGALGPFGLLILASKGLKEHTAVFFRIYKGPNKYVVIMCSDQSRSSLDNDNDKTTYGTFLNVDPVHENLSLRSLIDHSIVESFGIGGKACITARVYPTLAVDDRAHLYAFNYGTEGVRITSLNAWSMKKAHIN